MERGIRGEKSFPRNPAFGKKSGVPDTEKEKEDRNRSHTSSAPIKRSANLYLNLSKEREREQTIPAARKERENEPTLHNPARPTEEKEKGEPPQIPETLGGR